MNFNSLEIGFGEFQTGKSVLVKVITIIIVLVMLTEHNNGTSFIVNITEIIDIKTIYHSKVE